MTVTTQAPASHIGLEQIEAAREVIKGQVVRTPTIAAPKLSELTGAEVYIKCENLQFTNSFKDRGALVKLASLSESEARRGVIAMSAGNHAQAVAYHARRLGIPATIVMPEHTPFVKVANTEAFGAEIILSGRGLYEAQTRPWKSLKNAASSSFILMTILSSSPAKVPSRWRSLRTSPTST